MYAVLTFAIRRQSAISVFNLIVKFSVMYIYLTTIIIIIIALCIVFISWISHVLCKELCGIISEQTGVEGL